MKKATALLLNWKRPQNQKMILESIRNQSIPIDIFLWNNNSEDKYDYDADLKINSSKNLICWPRWLIACFAETEYIFTLDDDIMFSQEDVIEKCIYFFEKNRFSIDTIIGKFGVILNSEKNYFGSNHIQAANEQKYVDVVKGRFMFMRTEFIKNIYLNLSVREDDIYISSFSKNKIIPDFLKTGFKKLEQGEVSLWKQKEHKISRQKAVDEYL